MRRQSRLDEQRALRRSGGREDFVFHFFDRPRGAGSDFQVRIVRHFAYEEHGLLARVGGIDRIYFHKHRVLARIEAGQFGQIGTIDGDRLLEVAETELALEIEAADRIGLRKRHGAGDWKPGVSGEALVGDRHDIGTRIDLAEAVVALRVGGLGLHTIRGCAGRRVLQREAEFALRNRLSVFIDDRATDGSA